jgi:hypothetical protein
VGDDPEQLWRWALEDAGLAAGTTPDPADLDIDMTGPAPAVLARMRKELEHVRQARRAPAIPRFSAVLESVCEALVLSLPGAGPRLCSFLPAEHDAGVAAARLVRARFPDAAHDTLGDGVDPALAVSSSLPIGEHLPHRLVACAALFPMLFAAMVRDRNAPGELDSGPVAARLVSEVLPSGGPDLFAACARDATVSDVREDLLATVTLAWQGRGSWTRVGRMLELVQHRGVVLSG